MFLRIRNHPAQHPNSRRCTVAIEGDTATEMELDDVGCRDDQVVTEHVIHSIDQ